MAGFQSSLRPKPGAQGPGNGAVVRWDLMRPAKPPEAPPPKPDPVEPSRIELAVKISLITARLKALDKARENLAVELDAIRAMAIECGVRETSPATVAEIGYLLDLVSKVSEVGTVDIKAHRNQPTIVKARHIVCWLARRFSLQSLPSIGRVLGGRDHSTIISAVRRVDFVVSQIGSPSRDEAEEWATHLWLYPWDNLTPPRKNGRYPGRTV